MASSVLSARPVRAGKKPRPGVLDMDHAMEMALGAAPVGFTAL